LKIIRVAEYVHPDLGSISANEYSICKALAARGHKVTVFSSDIAPSRDEINLSWNELQLTTNPRIVLSKALINLGGDMPIMPDLGWKLRSADADIIHAHEYYNYTSLTAFLVASKSRVSFTYTQDRYYQINRPFWRVPFLVANSTILKMIRERPRLVTALSTAASRFLVAQGYPRNRISVIPMGVDVEKFRPLNQEEAREYLGTRDAPTVLTIARLHPSKNVSSLIQAMTIVKRSVTNAKLVIAGRGRLIDRLRREAYNLGLRDVVFFTKRVPDDEVPLIYNACDVFVLPSLYEPFGLVVLEAMSCGKPVVVASVGGMQDTVRENRNGFKVPLTDTKGFVRTLASKILALLQHADLRDKFGEAGRQIACVSYTFKAIAEKYETFYERFLQESSGR